VAHLSVEELNRNSNYKTLPNCRLPSLIFDAKVEHWFKRFKPVENQIHIKTLNGENYR